ncbi:MAG: hypothetical protein ACXVP4_03895, partial [Bacteroidia bacterium]
MIFLTMIIIYKQEKGIDTRIIFMEWMLLILGSFTTIISFVWDYILYISKYGEDKGVWTLSSNKNMFEEVRNYVPEYFNWYLFWTGEGIILLAIFLIYKRIRKE